jgi:hypothetical protein
VSRGRRAPTRLPPLLLLVAAAYCIASFVHFFHNAEYLAEYPNMPAWLLRWQVYATWLGITAIGIGGLLLARRRYPAIGFALVAIYAALGFDGLEHYALAPMSSHTLAMNLTIWSEVVAAAVLLLVTLRYLISGALRSPRGTDTEVRCI